MVRHIKKILFTTDLSKSAIEVFEQTVALATQTGASIVMLHVIEDGSTSGQNRTVHLVNKDDYEKIRNDRSNMVKNVLIGKMKSIPLIQNALQELGKNANDKMCVENIPPVIIDDIIVLYGIAADLITQMTEIAECDLVVMGYHKKGSILKALMGSAGKRVLQQSKKPLMLVPLES
ncbi:MAG: universal stress protein [Proteobacteria bacterium]|nr:universal stress protein [Pseudomonadota bacterium]